MAEPFDSQTGLLMVGHGSRECEGNVPLLALCRSLGERVGSSVIQPCYLELAEPTIGDGLSALHRRGITRTIVVPLQLTAGRHVRHDIPCAVGRCLPKMSEMFISFTEHLGAHPRLLEIADTRLDEAMGDRRPSSGSTEFLLVARGSRDPLVRGEILRLAEHRGAGEGDRVFFPCFLATTQPSLDQALQQAVSRRPGRIVVQPYLLYPGRLFQQIQSRVTELSQHYPQIEWVLTGALGPDPSIIECVLDLAVEATRRDLHWACMVYGADNSRH